MLQTKLAFFFEQLNKVGENSKPAKMSLKKFLRFVPNVNVSSTFLQAKKM